MSERRHWRLFYIMGFGLLSTRSVRNNKPPAMRVGTKKLYKKITNELK